MPRNEVCHYAALSAKFQAIYVVGDYYLSTVYLFNLFGNKLYYRVCARKVKILSEFFGFEEFFLWH